jgi:hypothetical protein
MGSWFAKEMSDPAEAASYIADCLYRTSGGVFWDIVSHYDLRAKTPFELGEKVYTHLMDFEMDAELREEGR